MLLEEKPNSLPVRFASYFLHQQNALAGRSEMNALNQNSYLFVLFMGLVWLAGMIYATRRKDAQLLLRLSITICFMSLVLQLKVIKSNFQLIIILILIYCIVGLLLWIIEVIRSRLQINKGEKP